MLSQLTLLLAACAATAWLLARRFPPHRPVAWLLSWICASGPLRAALRAPLSGPPPYHGPLYHVEQFVALSLPFALVGAALFCFQRRSVSLVVGAWLGTSATFAACYPWLRGERRDIAHASVTTAAIVVALLCVARHRERWLWQHITITTIWGIFLAVTAVVLWWPNPTAHWWIARTIQSVGYATILCYQVWRLTWKLN